MATITGLLRTLTHWLAGANQWFHDWDITLLGPRLPRGVHVITDKSTAYTMAMPKLGVALTQANAKKHTINRVNALHSNLKGFMAGFRGVSTKHLQSYLDWFEWRRLFRSNTDGDDSRLLARQLDNGLYRRRRTYYTGLRSPIPITGACEWARLCHSIHVITM